MMRWRRDAAPASSRILFLVAAVGCLSTAVLLILRAGLPERAVYTGSLLGGQIVAPEISASAPPFRTAALAGGDISLADLRGAPVVINFWATWCEPCRAEMPILQAVYARHAPGLRMIGVNLGEPAQIARDWVSAFGLTFDIALDPRGQVAALYRLRGQPSTYVISPQGIIAHIFYGPVAESALEAAVLPLLAD